ncbi:MAG: hypothetical protein WBW88_05015, partial [Rhodothermales bacterium]
MTAFRKTFLWLLIGFFGLTSAALADKNKNQREIDALKAKKLEQLRLEWATAGKTYGSCQAGVDFKDLNINSVRARLYNNGGLFWKGAGPLYNVPQSGAGNAIFASGIWLGGLVDGDLRMIASDYGPWELWPGPLDDNGNPPADCSAYDHLYKVDRQDVLNYEDTGVATPDLTNWPFDLGAPVVDGDGNPDNYNLAGGDRPQVLGDQTIWWVMNDRGNEHGWSLTQPIGLEVQVTAFAFKTADAINNTTFYKYKLINKGGQQLTETYFGLWSDPDLGDATNDYVGSDTTRGIGYVWNGTDFDGGSDGYGNRPPALGYDFFQGPLVNDDGIDNDHDGEVDEADERLGGTKFVYYSNDSTVQGNPLAGGTDAYRYLRGFWLDDVPITFGGSGRGFSNTPTDFMFPGDPPAFWSEEDTDGAGTRNAPADRRFLISSGPFTLQPGAVQELVFGIVWSQADDRFGSVEKMKADDALAQAAFDVNFQLPAPPDPPRVQVSELDGTVILKWGYNPSDNNYLDQYEVTNPFLADVDVDDKTYNFEGYQVYQFTSDNDLSGQVIATYDVPDGVTKVVDISDATLNIPIASISVNGSDSGVKHSIQFANLTNYTDYYFGVQAYAHNPNSAPLISKSAITRVKVRPSKRIARNGGTAVSADAVSAAAAGALDGTATFTEANGLITKTGKGGGLVEATVVDPSVLTGDTYKVNFYSTDLSDDPENPDVVTNYDVVNGSGTKVFDGSAAVSSFGRAAPQGSNVFVADGLSWTVSGPDPGPYDLDGTEAWAFIQVQGGDGIAGDACDAGAVSTFGCAEAGGNWVYGSYNGAADWIMYHSGAGPEEVIGGWAPNDFEIRATDAGSYGYFGFSSGNIIHVPAEVWDIGPTGPFGVNDPSDDVEMIPVLFSDGGGECFFGFGEGDDPFGLGWQITDRIYAYYSTTTYADWEAAAKPLVDADPDGCPTSPETDDAAGFVGEGRPLQRVVWMMDPTSPNYRDEFIPVGNVIRFLTTKPNLPGDVFTVNTSGYQVKTQDPNTAQDALDAHAIVPNPDKGASDYELTNLADIVRFTNMPQEATIRVFTLAGSLVKTLNKSGPSTSLDWDLTTEEGLPVASGMYLVYVEVPGVG